MYPVSARFHANVTRPESGARVLSRIEVLVDRHVIDLELAVVDGRVNEAEGALSRRSLSCTVVDRSGTLVPREIGDLLASPRTELRVARGFVWRDGTEELARLGVFRLGTRHVGESSAGNVTISLSGMSREQRIAADTIDAPRVIASGVNIGELVEELILEADPAGEILRPDTGVVVPAEQVIEGDRWVQCTELAELAGWELLCDADGRYVMRVPASTEVDGGAADNSVWSLVEGPDSTMIALSRNLGADRPPTNRIVVVAAGTHIIDPILAVAEDGNPESPTYVGHGRVTERVTVTDLQTQDELDEMAETELRKQRGLAEQIAFTTVPHPGLQTSDPVRVGRDRLGVDARYLVGALSTPLDVAGTQTGTMRRRRIQWTD